jgi:parallel beta-helix repeat protein
MKKLKWFGIAFVLVFFLSMAADVLLTAPAAEAAVKTNTVKAETQSAANRAYSAKVVNCKNYVYIYASPRLNSKKLVRAYKDATMTVVKANATKYYHKVTYKGKTGYIRKAYSKLVKKTTDTSSAATTEKTTAATVSTTKTGTVADNTSKEDATAADPTVYTIDNTTFGISADNKNARATTDGINKALNWAKDKGYKTIKFAQGTYLIQCTWNNRYIAPTDGIMVPSGLTLDLGNSTFIMEANSYPAYAIFALVDQSNITIKGGTLIGDLGKHKYANVKGSETHEWGFGIITSASKNVVIKGVTIKNMIGDGIILEGSYQPKTNGGRESANVKILNCTISNCRRQGISVIGAPGSEIAGNKIFGIDGTDPQYGIDVEPEFDYSVKGLKIHGNTVYGCTGGAIDACRGSGYEIYENTCIKNNILAALSSDVKIYKNTLEDTFIRVMGGTTNVTAEDNILKGKSWVFIG